MTQTQIPDQMTAVVLDSYSGPEALRVEQRPPTGNSFTQSLGEPVERFMASVCYEQRGKLEQLGIEIGSTD